MPQRISTIVRSSLFLFVLLLAGCAPSTPLPVLSSWSDQLVAIEHALPNMSDDLILIGGSALPKRERGESHGVDEPIELGVYLTFQDQKLSRVDADGVPLYATWDITFNDHRLATTLAVSEERLTPRQSDALTFDSRSIRLSAQDALQLTLTEGQTYMGMPVDRGNILIHLRGLGDSSVESNARPVWEFTFYRGKDHTLTVSIDAQTGAILNRTEQ